MAPKAKQAQSSFTACTIEPAAWQRYVDDLMRVHWALLRSNYQAIPDRTAGDRGLEGFSVCGTAIQAYADVKSRTFDERRKGQKNKVLADLRKLVKYADWWEATLQDVRIRYWCLVVPHLDDANVVTYARTKGKELQNKKLPFLADDFQALVHTDGDYPRAKSVISNPRLAYREIGRMGTPSDGERQLLRQDHTFMAHLEAKASTYLDSPSRETLQEEIEHQGTLYLKAQNYLERLRAMFPSDWEDLEQLSASLADAVLSDNRLSSDAPHSRVADLRRAYINDVATDHPDMPTGVREMLASGLLAKWLGDCTLRFRKATQHAQN